MTPASTAPTFGGRPIKADILLAVCRRRHPHRSDGDHVAAWIMFHHNGWSYPDIARAIGWRSHGASHGAVKAVETNYDLRHAARWTLASILEIEKERP